MENKEAFGKYIMQKRKEAGLSQKELADKIFVSSSAVSKWERGLSYPDIILISSLCDALHISEHELVTASDDEHQREVEAQSRKFLKILKTYSWFTYIIYAGALIPTFLVNLIRDGRLSWFFIVFAAMCMVFSVLTVPLLTKKQKAKTSLTCLFLSLLLLLVVCRIVVGGHWLLMTILGILLGCSVVFLPFVLKGQRWKKHVGKRRGLICMTTDTILVYLIVIWGCVWYRIYEQKMFLATALGVTTFAAAAFWIIFLIIRYLKLGWMVKVGISVAICGVWMFFSESILNVLIDQKPYVKPVVDLGDWVNCINANMGVLALIAGIAFAIICLILGQMRKR